MSARFQISRSVHGTLTSRKYSLRPCRRNPAARNSGKPLRPIGRTLHDARKTILSEMWFAVEAGHAEMRRVRHAAQHQASCSHCFAAGCIRRPAEQSGPPRDLDFETSSGCREWLGVVAGPGRARCPEVSRTRRVTTLPVPLWCPVSIPSAHGWDATEMSKLPSTSVAAGRGCSI